MCAQTAERGEVGPGVTRLRAAAAAVGRGVPGGHRASRPPAASAFRRRGRPLSSRDPSPSRARPDTDPWGQASAAPAGQQGKRGAGSGGREPGRQATPRQGARTGSPPRGSVTDGEARVRPRRPGPVSPTRPEPGREARAWPGRRLGLTLGPGGWSPTQGRLSPLGGAQEGPGYLRGHLGGGSPSLRATPSVGSGLTRSEPDAQRCPPRDPSRPSSAAGAPGAHTQARAGPPGLCPAGGLRGGPAMPAEGWRRRSQSGVGEAIKGRGWRPAALPMTRPRA